MTQEYFILREILLDYEIVLIIICRKLDIDSWHVDIVIWIYDKYTISSEKKIIRFLKK